MTVTYYVYLLTNWNNKVIYLGVTNNLERRLYEYKLVKEFIEKYNVNIWYSPLSRPKWIKNKIEFSSSLLTE